MSKPNMKNKLAAVFQGAQQPTDHHDESPVVGGGDVARPVADQPQKPEKEFKVAFNLQMSQSLHRRLSYYADNFAVGRGSSSMTRIVLEAVEKHLAEIERKAGIKTD